MEWCKGKPNTDALLAMEICPEDIQSNEGRLVEQAGVACSHAYVHSGWNDLQPCFVDLCDVAIGAMGGEWKNIHLCGDVAIGCRAGSCLLASLNGNRLLGCSRT